MYCERQLKAFKYDVVTWMAADNQNCDKIHQCKWKHGDDKSSVQIPCDWTDVIKRIKQWLQHFPHRTTDGQVVALVWWIMQNDWL